MKTYLLLFCTIFFIPFVSSSMAQGVIKGTVLAHDGQPLERASIQVVTNELSFPRDVIRQFPVSPDGTFTIDVEPPGLFRLQFSGFYHIPYELPIYLTEQDTVELDVFLGTPSYIKKRKSLAVYLYTYAAGEGSRNAAVLKKKDDAGRFLLHLQGKQDSVYYELKTKLGRAHGPSGDRFSIGRRGEYESIIYLNGKRDTTVAIDLTLLPDAATEPRFVIHNSPQETQKFADVYRDFDVRNRKSEQHQRKLRSEGVPSYDIDYDWQKDIKALTDQLEAETDPFKKQVRYLMLMHAGFLDEWLSWRPDRQLSQEFIELIPPTSPLHSYWPFLIMAAIDSASQPEERSDEPQQDLFELQRASDPYAEFIYALSHLHPDSTTHRSFLSGAINWAFEQKRFEEFEQYYNEYMTTFEGTMWADDMEQQFKPLKRTAPGSKVPEFAFVSMDDPSHTITPDQLLGTSYLISFWATWCGPCITKMEDLHRMYEHYAEDDFEILSVSIDFQEEHATQFRADKWPMPWLNAYVHDWTTDDEVLKMFEVIGIPKTILVDSNGNIIAVERNQDEFYDTILSHMRR